jgi:hypothetical protein
VLLSLVTNKDKSNAPPPTCPISLTDQLFARSTLLPALSKSRMAIKRAPLFNTADIAAIDINLANIRGPLRLPDSEHPPINAWTFNPPSVTEITHVSVAAIRLSPLSGKLKLLAPLAPTTATKAPLLPPVPSIINRGLGIESVM